MWLKMRINREKLWSMNERAKWSSSTGLMNKSRRHHSLHVRVDEASDRCDRPQVWTRGRASIIRLTVWLMGNRWLMLRKVKVSLFTRQSTEPSQLVQWGLNTRNRIVTMTQSLKGHDELTNQKVKSLKSSKPSNKWVTSNSANCKRT